MIEQELVNLLIKKGYKISFAESMTGGLLAASLVNISDASKVFEGSFVTYSDKEKNKMLGVSLDTINKYNVVSKEVALEMVNGLKNKIDANIYVSITGSAGPNSYEGIPVGLFYVGIIINDKEEVLRFQYDNIGRNKIREKAKNEIFAYLIKKIQ